MAKKSKRFPFGTAGLPSGRIVSSPEEIRRRQRLPEGRVRKAILPDAQVESSVMRDLFDQAGDAS